ncbi:MAG: hypothetical protein LBH68_01670, partial [Bifidobacteriaceae bacterium]|nr:hypothetical protein [Bifidobacteriaceae bacterium]
MVFDAAGPTIDMAVPPLADVGADASQAEALALIAQGGPVTVFGFPGTGKTLLAELAAAQALTSGKRVAVLTEGRHLAAELDARIVRRAGLAQPSRVAVTPTSFAMSILRARAQAVAASGADGAVEAARAFEPQMVNGSDQAATLSELLRSAADGDLPGVNWDGLVPREALGLAAFRAEVRDLLTRAAERGLDAVGLEALGRREDRPEWIAAAHLYQAYLDRLALPSAGDVGLKLDAAAMVAQAELCLARWDFPVRLPGGEVTLEASARPAWDMVIMDSYQEASLALHSLAARLVAGGAQVVVLASPESTAQTYRGALPWQAARSLAPAPAGWEAAGLVL